MAITPNGVNSGPGPIAKVSGPSFQNSSYGRLAGKIAGLQSQANRRGPTALQRAQLGSLRMQGTQNRLQRQSNRIPEQQIKGAGREINNLP